MTQMHKPRAIVYVRLSSLRDESASVSPVEQEEACRAYATAKGWDVVDVISDLDVSGSAKGLRLDRPGLLRVREALPSVEYVIARSIDRIARSVADFVALAEEAERHGVALATVKESLDFSTPQGRFVGTILAAFAQMEAETIAARVADGRAGMRRQGRWGGGYVPFGYKSAPFDENDPSAGRTLVPDADEAATVRRGAELILSGVNIWNTCKTLDAEGHKPRAAQAWHYTSLRNILTSDAVLGRLRHRGKPVRDEHGNPVVAFPPILERDDYERLRRILRDGNRRTRADNVKAPGRQITATQLLSELAVCEGCGKRLYSSWGTRKIKGKAVRVERYVCSNAYCERRTTISEHLIEPYVSEQYLERFGRMQYVEAREFARDVSALADVEERIHETAEAMTRPGADIAALSAHLSSLSSERERLSREPTETRVEYLSTGETIRERWEAGDLHERRGLLAQGIEIIRVGPGQRGRKGLDPDRIAISWREGGEPAWWDYDYT